MNERSNGQVHLQPWYDNWLKEHICTNLIYAYPNGSDCPSLKQVHFIRDRIGPMVWADVHYYKRPRALPRYDCRETAMVIGEHRSKSVRLPVYSITREDFGLQLTLRDNYYNWKLSVSSQIRPIEVDFSGLFHTTPPVELGYTGNSLSPVYFEGFPEDRIFGYYSLNHFKFSAEIHSDEALWTTVFLMMRSLGVIKAFEWNTEESHKRKLDEDRELSNIAREEEVLLREQYPRDRD